MDEIKIRMAEDGAVVIPVEYRQTLRWQIGDELIMRLVDGEIHIFAPEQAIKHAQKVLRQFISQGRSLTDELLAERRLEQ